MITKTNPQAMTHNEFVAYATENDVRYASNLHSLEVYENDVRIYTFRETVGETMFMGEHKYKYKYKYMMFRGTKYGGENSQKARIFNSKLYTLIKKYI
jgi:hypothetical protein